MKKTRLGWDLALLVLALAAMAGALNNLWVARAFWGSQAYEAALDNMIRGGSYAAAAIASLLVLASLRTWRQFTAQRRLA